MVKVKLLELCSILPLTPARPTQCVPVSSKQVFPLPLVDALVFLRCTRKRRHVCPFVCAPNPNLTESKEGKGKSEVPSRVTAPACVFPLQPLFLQRVGCDYEIDSNATEDRCGVCLGDGSACQTVRKMFKQKEGSGNKRIHN